MSVGMERRGGVGWLVPLALLATGCSAPPERAYYAPEGMPFGNTIASYREESVDALVVVRCQGVYVNTVGGEDVLTVHVQFDVARPRSGDLQLPWEAIVVDLDAGPGHAHHTLRLSEAWSARQPLTGPLVVPSWSRRPFDLFFDAPGLVGGRLPEHVLLRWATADRDDVVEGQSLFTRIDPTDPRAPADEPIADLAFGMRNGYYMPGRLTLGERGLQPSTEERMHYVFHAPGRWWPW